MKKIPAKEQRIPPRHGTFGEKIPPQHGTLGQKIPPQHGTFGEKIPPRHGTFGKKIPPQGEMYHGKHGTFHKRYQGKATKVPSFLVPLDRVKLCPWCGWYKNRKVPTRFNLPALLVSARDVLRHATRHAQRGGDSG